MLASLRLSLLSLVLTAFASPANAQSAVGLGFEGCGTMVDGVECVMFAADSGSLYLLNSPVPVALGDRIRVVGVIDVTCITFCQQGACLNASVVEACPTATAACSGDGGDQAGCTNCPCGNNAPLGSAGGCLNSTGTSAELVASGTPNPLDDQLRFEVTGANPGTFGILLSASQLLPSNPANPCPAGSGVQAMALDGIRCIGVGLKRHGVRATDANGDIGVTNTGWGGIDPPMVGLIAQGGFVSGQTRHWQAFYREAGTLVCQRGQNTTNALSTTFTPGPFWEGNPTQ